MFLGVVLHSLRDCRLYVFMFLELYSIFKGTVVVIFLCSRELYSILKGTVVCISLCFRSCTPFLKGLLLFFYGLGSCHPFSSDLPLKKDMPNSQRYPLNFHLTNNIQHNILLFSRLKKMFHIRESRI